MESSDRDIYIFLTFFFDFTCRFKRILKTFSMNNLSLERFVLWRLWELVLSEDWGVGNFFESIFSQYRLWDLMIVQFSCIQIRPKMQSVNFFSLKICHVLRIQNFHFRILENSKLVNTFLKLKECLVYVINLPTWISI